MSSGTQSRSCKRSDTRLLVLAGVIMSLPFVTANYSSAQIHGIPPSVTSIQYHTPPFLPNVPPSVTSLGPRGYGNGQFPPVSWPFPGRWVPGRGYIYGHGYRNNYGYSTGYIAPYYIPAYDTSYGYDTGGGGGPYMYSGPPAEQTLHIVVDLPTTKRGIAQDEDEEDPAPAKRDNAMPDAKAVDATVLVFRDGHQQEVSNYAIMGQTVYVFDNHTQKIALTDLDVEATVKLNDDRGVDFHVPAHAKS